MEAQDKIRRLWDSRKDGHGGLRFRREEGGRVFVQESPEAILFADLIEVCNLTVMDTWREENGATGEETFDIEDVYSLREHVNRGGNVYISLK